MSFLKSLFSNKINPNSVLSTTFVEDVKKAIHILGNNNDSLEDDEVLNLLISNGVNRREATEIVLFLPIAFIRHWVTEVNWTDTYDEYVSQNNFVEKRYSQTAAYQIIWKVTEDYFNNNPDRDTVLKIGGRSAECHGMNQLLNDDPSAKIKDIVFSKTVINRPNWI